MQGRPVEELMPVILAIVIAVAWILILAPSFVRRQSERGVGLNSISHFHRQLRILEHTSPDPIVTPAYRLRTAAGSAPAGLDDGGPPPFPVLTVVGARDLPRPALAFLGEDPAGLPDGSADGTAAATGGSPVRSAFPADPVPAAGVTARQLARRRRRDTLGVLSATVVTTALLGFLPGASAAWIVSVIAGAALSGYVVLLVRLRRQAEERERKLRYLRPDMADGGEAWRDGDVVAPGSRYSHPSYQVAASH